MQHPDADRQVPTLALHDLFRLIRTYWRGFMLITVLCMLVALGWSLIQPKIYSSTATGVIVATGAQDYTSAVAGEDLARTKALSYVSLSNTRPVAEKVIRELMLDASPEGLVSQVGTEVPTGTSEIRVHATAETAQGAADIANAWIGALAAQARELEGDRDLTGTALNALNFETVSSANVPQEPISPEVTQNLMVGMFGGLVLGLLYAFVRSGSDRRIRSADNVRATLEVPVLGLIPQDDRLSTPHVVIDATGTEAGTDRAYSEAVRKLRTNLSFSSVDNPPQIIVITSSLPGEGKSSITANLAVAIASTGRNVVVVDGDLRRPMLTEIFGLTPGAGLSDVLNGEARVDDVLQTYDDFPNLQVLGAGRTVPNPTELLSSKAMHTLFETFAEDALVLVDAPPLLPYTDAALLTASADGALIVATAGKTTTDDVRNALDSMERVHGNVLGVVLNRATAPGAQYHDQKPVGQRPRPGAHEKQPKQATSTVMGWR
ncbi:Tyrosine-protein kinase YwqD [Kocuria rosea]|uniref:polysaccharide biosynthesis tyrosine autokinase n=1 Tax=Kocuria rosea TaxID=1275 RepID=UPI000F6F62A8|nr:polysaccharide biosynthesis tyrosine autokinase [Kocuria rosea]VEH42543.1 Tyrosine-protein kinase YwqD [Kocuria rosea]